MRPAHPPGLNVAQCLGQAQALGLARHDAQLLLLHCLGQGRHDRAWLLTHDTEVLTEAQQTHWQRALERRVSGEPVAYITGLKDFFGLTLSVDARVLDPRPDTETLVEWALALLPAEARLRVLDLGTGSGAVALAVQHQRPHCEVCAVDVSQEALEVARANAQRLNLPVQFVHSHWLDKVQGRFDLIVSNPPYVAEGDPHMPALRHEPRQALTSGPSGLQDIDHIVAHAPQYLQRGSWLLLEHGWDQAQAVQKLLSHAGFSNIQTRQDLAGVDRCTGGCFDSER